MKKICLRIFTMLLSVIVYSQSLSLLPKVVPVSPEAANLGKYGDLPVNLATGRINYSIPIFTIKEGDFELPIYLSYNHTGLLAEDDPGLAGLGWTLHAGGMIIRQLRGKPDETSGIGYVGGNIGKDYVIPFIKGTISDVNKRTLIDGADTGSIDTQPDKFIINVGNLSGNFFFNELGQPVFTPRKNFKTSFNNNKFNVIDDLGHEYEFAKKEITSSEFISNGITTNHIVYTSSWGVTKIFPLNRTNSINFSYDNGASYQKTGYSQSKLKPIGFSGSSNVCDQNLSIRTSLSLTDITSMRQLSSIEFSQGKIEFDIKETPSNSLANNKNYLNKIIIKNKQGVVINTYEFKYDNLLSNFKLLQEVVKFNKEGITQPFFKMNYKGTPPLSINYKSQDNFGFYNNQTNNQSLLEGNRESHFSAASLGALTKVIYPTGGFTEIAYESNQVPKGTLNTCNLPKHNKSESINLNTASYNLPSKKDIFIKQKQKIIVTLRTRADISPAGSDLDENLGTIIEAFASIEGLDPIISCAADEDCGFLDCRKSITTIMENGVQLNGGNKFVSAMFSVKANTTITLNAKLEGFGTGLAYASVSYYNPDFPDPIPPIEDNSSANVGGIRVVTTKSCVKNGDCITKNYKYIFDDGKTSGTPLFQPIYKNIISHVGPGIECSFTQKTANSRIPLSSFQGAPVLYKRVEVHLGVNSNGGKQVNEYTSVQNPIPLYPFAPLNTKDWKKGNIKNQKIYKKEVDDFFLVKEIENDYEISFPYLVSNYLQNAYGFIARRNIFSYGSIGEEIVSMVGNLNNDYALDYYYNRPEFYHLASSTTTDYLEGNEVSLITTNTYDELTGYLKTQTSTNSKGDLIKSEILYPGDKAELSGLKLSAAGGIDKLVLQNRINLPIQSKTYRNGILLSKTRQNYKDRGNNIVSLEDVQTSKGSNSLEDRIIYHSYDDKGNPTEVSKKGGTHIVYIWGYNQTQPIVKIEGSTLSEVTTAISSINNSNFNTLEKIQSLSNNDDDREIDIFDVNGNLISQGTESKLREALRGLRERFNNSVAQVTTYTYDPLIGVTSITDPRGEIIYYHYDDFNRLEYVKDAQGKILSKNEYNYKN